MKSLTSISIAILLFIGISSCDQKQGSTSTDKKFEETKEIAKNRNLELFGIFNNELNKEEAKVLPKKVIEIS